MSLSGKRVAIIGGSFAGVSFALALCKFSVERNLPPPAQIVIFEKEEGLHKKDILYSYSISIRSDSGGCQVLENLGVEAKARQHETHSSGFWVAVGDAKSARKIAHLGWAGSRPGIRASRLQVWKALYDALDPNIVDFRWNSAIGSVKELGDEVELILTSGGSHKFDTVIVADGSRSQIREQLLPQEVTTFAGVQMISGAAPVEKRIEFLEESHGAIWSSGYSVFLSDEGNGEVIWGVSTLTSAPNEKADFANGTKKDKKEAAVKWSENLPPFVKEIVLNTPEDKIHAMNCCFKHPHKSVGRVVFIGDSCHAVSPFSANGASSALIDGYNLASELMDPKKSYSVALRDFSAEMISRVEKVIDQGNLMIKMSHSSSWTYNIFRNSALRFLSFVINYPTAAKVSIGLVTLGALGAGIYGGSVLYNKLK